MPLHTSKRQIKLFKHTALKTDYPHPGTICVVSNPVGATFLFAIFSAQNAFGYGLVRPDSPDESSAIKSRLIDHKQLCSNTDQFKQLRGMYEPIISLPFYITVHRLYAHEYHKQKFLAKLKLKKFTQLPASALHRHLRKTFYECM